MPHAGSDSEYGNIVEEAATMAELAPRGELEVSRDIKSLHYSKFADKDAEGNDILPALLDNLGVDSTPCGLSNLRRLTGTELTSRSSCGSRLSRTIPRPSLSAQRS